MGKASLTIAISGAYNGKAIEKAEAAMRSMSVTAASVSGGVTGSLANAGAAAAEMGGSIYNAGQKMESIGSAATKSITLPIAAAAVACGKAAIDIDTSLTNVKKTVDGTEEQYQQLKNAAIEFSKTNAVSATQILDIQSLGAQLGFTIDELQEFGEVTSGLDIATNMNAEQAGTEMAQFANITKMAHGQISNYASAIVGLGNTSATTESDISSMAMRIAASGTQVGMSQADILGMSAALASLGVEAEAGGTAISTIMAQIDKDVALSGEIMSGTSTMAAKDAKKVTESLETWAATAGMTAEDFANAWKGDPVDALSSLLGNMEQTTDEGGNMSVMLEELGIDSIRQTDIMKRLAGNSSLVAKTVATANDEWEKNTALTNEVNNRNASMEARFEMLKNKVIAVAESVGTPLVNAALEFVDAAEPVLNIVAEVAQSFADMDETDQKMIVGLVAAAAAFGPVVTVVGKLVKGYGNLITGAGKVMQSMSTLAVNVDGVSSSASKLSKGTEAASSSSDSLSKSMSVAAASAGKAKVSALDLAEAELQSTLVAKQSSNQALMAARKKEISARASGAASQAEMQAAKAARQAAQLQVDADMDAVRAAKEKVLAVGSSTDSVDKSVAAARNSVLSTKDATKAVSAQTTATAAASSATKAQTVATKAQTVAMNAGKAAASRLGMALKAAAPLAVVAVIVSLADAFGQAQERASLFADATTGLEEAMGAATSAYDAAKQPIDSVTESLGDNVLSAKDALEAQASLAKTCRDTWADYGTNAAMVDSYAKTIEELGNKGSLSAGDQERLRLAVEGFNEATGSSIGIINGQTGELSMQKDAILEVAEAYKTEARAEAARELYKETTKQLIQDQISLKQATDELATAEDGFGIWLGDFPLIADPASVKYHELQQNVDDLTAATDSASKTQSDLLNVMAGSQASFDTLDQALEATGVNMEDFGSIGDAELQGLQQNFDGTLNSIVATCSQQGIQIPSALATSISENSGLPAEAQQIMFDALVLQMSGGNVELAAKALGHDIDDGLRAGIEGSADLPEAAIGVMSDETIAKAKECWDSHSPSQVMYSLGGDINTGLANGITDTSGQPTGAMGTLSGLMQSAISGLPGFSQQTGSSSGSGLASAIGGFAGSVAGAAGSLFSSATSGISGTSSAFSGTGRSAASGFSGSIGNASAYGSGRSLANTANSGLGSVSARSAGYYFTQGFAGGMNSVNLWSAAYSIGKSALGGIMTALGIASPSKEARKVGQFFGQGAVIGMQDEEDALLRQSRAMSEAMALDPSPYETQKHVARLDSERSGFQGGVTMNVTINVTCNDAGQATQVGKNIANGLYTEFARRERTFSR